MKSIRLELDDESYARLQREAERLGVDPESAARTALCEHLAAEPTQPSDLDAILDELEQMTAKLPEVDAVQLVREARNELEERDRRRWG